MGKELRNASGVGWIRRRVAPLTVAAVVVALAGPAAASAAAPPYAEDAGAAVVGRYVVRAPEGRLDDLVGDLDARGIAVERTLGIIDGAVVSLPASTVGALFGLDSVEAITPDVSLETTSSTYDPITDVGSVYNVAAIVDAPYAWDRGHTGKGVDVALIDTGVAPVGPLANPGSVLNGPDLSFDSQSDSTRYLDLNGHGTFMAGLIAGRATSDEAGAYQGIAPDARLVNVKVGDALGRADVSQVIAGIDWVVEHAQDDGLNIRVLNLSFGTDSAQSYQVDPLAHAAEVAWRKGIVVVAAAGNQGTSRLAMPAADPHVLAVGAWDSRGTRQRDDDALAAFSARGRWDRKLDTVAPGVRIQGLRVPGSYVDTALGTGGISPDYLRGSGTSQAAAITSGAAAVLLSARPRLTPDQVKGLLGRGAYLPGTRGTAVGRTLDLERALTLPAPYVKRHAAPRAAGTGSLEAARGSYHVSDGTTALTGERDIFGNPVDTAALAEARENGTAWVDGTWNGASWAGASWAGASWAGASWAGASWAGASWAGASWAGASWAGATWATEDWS